MASHIRSKQAGVIACRLTFPQYQRHLVTGAQVMATLVVMRQESAEADRVLSFHTNIRKNGDYVIKKLAMLGTIMVTTHWSIAYLTTSDSYKQ
jgi:hypothetical protein